MLRPSAPSLAPDCNIGQGHAAEPAELKRLFISRHQNSPDSEPILSRWDTEGRCSGLWQPRYGCLFRTHRTPATRRFPSCKRLGTRARALRTRSALGPGNTMGGPACGETVGCSVHTLLPVPTFACGRPPLDRWNRGTDILSRARRPEISTRPPALEGSSCRTLHVRCTYVARTLHVAMHVTLHVAKT